jgi:ribonucleoside-diphosphate reductase subunit M1
VLAGEFQVVNPWLLKDLVDMGLWSDNMKNRIIADGGSIQRIPNIPDEIKALYKTVWEISQRTIVQMAADRGAFIDQSQSLNIHMKEPTMGKITSMHFAGWKLGLKTGMYYLRTMAASAPIQFTVDQEALKVEDTNVARALGNRKRGPAYASSLASPSPNPKPMYMQKSTPMTEKNGVPTPDSSPSSEAGPVSVPISDSKEHGNPQSPSPKMLAADPLAVVDDDAEKTKKQIEDDEETSKQREGDIYADAVLACSIENKEACVMCSG